jgi:hypothetical protein
VKRPWKPGGTATDEGESGLFFQPRMNTDFHGCIDEGESVFCSQRALICSLRQGQVSGYRPKMQTVGVCGTAAVESILQRDQITTGW